MRPRFLTTNKVEVDKLTERCRDQEETIRTLWEANNRGGEDLRAFQDAKDNAEGIIGRITAEKVILNDQVSTLRLEATATEATMRTLRGEFETQKNLIDHQKDGIDKRNMTIENLRAALVVLNEQIDTLKNSSQSSTTDDSLEKRIRTLEVWANSARGFLPFLPSV